MFVEWIAAVAAMLTPSPAQRPAPEVAQRALVQACAGKEGWSDPAPPALIHDRTYYVGTCGITALLIATPSGHVLIDGATPEAAPAILANIRKLGFKPGDVKLILSTHEHIDHVGGLAALKAATGAQVLARAPARAVLQSGKADADDPQVGVLPKFPGVVVDRIVTDGEVVRVGKHSFTAIATPGHTAGGTSWRWRSCAGGTCLSVVFADSLGASSDERYRFTDHPERVAMFRASAARLAETDCGLLITGHPSASNLFDRFAGKSPLVDPTACRTYAAGAMARLDARLAKERSQ